ncbi:MAG: hypothetical protein HQL48_10060, partial [Gammaproteobacteria bacterium]|nr:hypothetical protein [Gammaproteobacteria bacterium]
PSFEPDEDRTWFVFRLLVHPDALKGAKVDLVTEKDKAYDKAHDKAHDEAHDEAHDLSDTEIALLRACLTDAQGSAELLSALGYDSRTGNFKKAIKRLVDVLGALERTLPNALQSKNQKYRLTEKGKKLWSIQNNETKSD